MDAARLARHLELEEEKATLLISEGKKASEKAVINLRREQEQTLRKANIANNRELVI
jgi:hypothetical protein